MQKVKRFCREKRKKEKPQCGFSFHFCWSVYFSVFWVMAKRSFAKNLQARNPQNSINIAPK